MMTETEEKELLALLAEYYKVDIPTVIWLEDSPVLFIRIYIDSQNNVGVFVMNRYDNFYPNYNRRTLLWLKAQSPIQPGQTIQDYIKENVIPQYVEFLEP